MKIIISLLMIQLTANASYLRMQEYAQHKQYIKVLQEAKNSSSEYENPKLHLLWAKSAEKLGQYAVAMSAYERVLILEPDNTEAKTALNHIYSDSGKKGLSSNSSEEKQSNKLRAKASLNFGHDNNVNINASGDDLDAYYGVSLGLKKISSNFARVTANASYLYTFEEYDNWFMQSTLDLYAQNNFSAHLFNLTIPTAEIAIGYKKGNYLLYFPISYNNINYLDQDLLNIFAFTPRVRVSLQKNMLWDTSAIYTKRNYINTVDIGKDATTYGLQTGLYWNTLKTQFHVNAKYENRSADNKNNDRYVDASFFTFDSKATYYFSSSLITETKYLFRYSDYSDNIGTDATPSSISRDDYINEINVKFSYLLNKNTELYIQDTYTQSLSTYIPSEYSKNVFLLGVQVRY